MLASRLLLGCLLGRVASFGFTVPAGKSECFHESAKASERLSGEWKVLKGGMMDLDVQVTSPSGDHVYAAEREMEGSFAFYTTNEGIYAVCFSNTHSGEAEKQVSAKISVGEPPDLIKLAKTEHLTPIEERIKDLHESMNAVRDMQDQMREQDEVHHKMTRSTRSRLLWFTVAEAVVLVAVSLWQILYLKSFFEIKRVV
eukprot:CAMPEP_0119083042 /NCGR_PEP_ID=MMETSP1178-20130426/124115_1 /TAXON_ID=33656 /ORGANISM="unid sp, Strain CCMP2000" /LENGTH=198 /DNA_ID=CAMNT_0007065867 /DNA_START=11 /DNA_END=607 /DNA_ORIENTATION=+